MTARQDVAREIHDAWCSNRDDGYQGPCWGPTAEDYEKADERLANR